MNGELHLAFRLRDEAARALVERYVGRARHPRRLRVLEHGDRPRLPVPDAQTWRVLLAPDGACWSTEELADHWRDAEARGCATAQFLVGGPDGWPGEASTVASWAFGRVTLPHQLAAAVLAEQLYRVGTILAGHPYHLGHDGRGA